ncbi:MAG: N-acetylmuramoyl-L-alanine amidase [Candidatus Amulumruptor caecigallinarius]|uniref:N-acetylmuramoyl-L-alanine amidase n=1 Tax=Candidatus Amulumruptor caecigallinarius TaxID=2109911 RepID=A0A4V1LA98_9BACT|nr:MAG: N-acetylmuramoyl-L-alanine amidase [Candidatus Amulumruptor caecigallinarius]HJE39298.1 N-acetylmuramoyl-L-alanine amidase [Candidatus Amulumruptor caecigallinarius]
MRKITLIVVHCTAGPQSQCAADIVRYHTLPRRRGGLGWSTPGYHYIVEPSGYVAQVVPDWDIANGVKGHNEHAIHVAYVGGVDTSRRDLPAVDNRTEAQKLALRSLLGRLRRDYPSARIVGHRNLARKACPSFDAMKEYADL